MDGLLTGDERRVGDFDLVWNDGPVAPVISGSQSFLREITDSLSMSTSFTNASCPVSSENATASIMENLSCRQAPFGSRGGMQQQRNNEGSAMTIQAINANANPLNAQSFGNLFSGAPLNSFLGCLPMRQHFTYSKYTN